MILKLIRNRRTRYVYLCSLVEHDPFTGDRLLASVTESVLSPMLELFYPVSVTVAGLCLRGSPVPWRWSNVATRQAVESYLHRILRSGEEIRLEITHLTPAYPGYPYTNYNAYAWRVPCGKLIIVQAENSHDDE